MSIIVHSLRSGIATAGRHPRLTVIAWLSNALLAGVVALPSFAVFSSALGHSRESAQALEAFNLRVLWEVFHYDRSPVPGAIIALAAGLLVLWLVLSSFVAGGIFYTVSSGSSGEGAESLEEPGTRLAEFLAAGGGLFGRYLRLALITVLIAGFAQTLLGLASAPLLAALSNSPYEIGSIVAAALGAAQLVAIVGFLALVLDYARIDVSLSGRRSALRAWWMALRYVIRHPIATCSIGLVAATASTVVLAASLLLQASMPASTWLSIALLAAVQQLTMIARAAVRVAGIAAEARLAASTPVFSASNTPTDSPTMG